MSSQNSYKRKRFGPNGRRNTQNFQRSSERLKKYYEGNGTSSRRQSFREPFQTKLYNSFQNFQLGPDSGDQQSNTQRYEDKESIQKLSEASRGQKLSNRASQAVGSRAVPPLKLDESNKVIKGKEQFFTAQSKKSVIPEEIEELCSPSAHGDSNRKQSARKKHNFNFNPDTADKKPR